MSKKLPEGWKRVKLGDVFNITSGGTPSRKKNEYYEHGNIPWVKTGDLKQKYINYSSEYITEAGLENSSAKYFPKTTVLIAMYGATIGATSILRIDASTNQACAAFLPNNSVLPEYLYYYFVRNKENIISLGVGGAQPNISITILKSISIDIPTLEEQERIVSILEKAKDAIEKREESIKLLDELVKSRFIEMFGDPVNNPKGWEVKELKKLCENLDKMRVPITSNSRVSGIIPYYGASGIVDYVQEYIFDETLLLVSEDGANLLARVTPIAFEIRGKTWVNNHAHVLRFKDYELQKYIEYAINLQDVSQYITGTAQPKLNQSALNKFKVPVPPNDKLNEFLDTVKQVDKLKFEMENSLEELKNNFNSLMQKAFNGEL